MWHCSYKDERYFENCRGERCTTVIFNDKKEVAKWLDGKDWSIVVIEKLVTIDISEYYETFYK